MVAVLATIFGGLAALLHVYIFVLESVRWRHPSVWRIFGIRDQETADATRPMAYNQGFYNLFLAVGAAVGLVLVWLGADGSTLDAAGRALALFSLGSMVAAALVLLTTGLKYLRPAAIQGTMPLLGVVLLLLA
jgi:putative membrane protein